MLAHPDALIRLADNTIDFANVRTVYLLFSIHSYVIVKVNQYLLKNDNNIKSAILCIQCTLQP